MIDIPSIVFGWILNKTLEHSWGSVSTWLRAPSPRSILIIGPGGVGKTTLASLLGNGTPNVPISEYNESVGTETFLAKNHSKVDIVVLPGQEHRKDATWPPILRDLRAGNFRGVIFICSYGYHSIGDFSFRNHRLYRPGMSLADFTNKYTTACRKEEFKLFKQVCNEIRNSEKPTWLLTLTTKQDLWYDCQTTVKTHYSAQRFTRLLRECEKNKRTGHFRHESVFVSLLIRNFETGKEEILQHSISGYDQLKQQKSFERLISVFGELMKWENQHAKTRTRR